MRVAWLVAVALAVAGVAGAAVAFASGVWWAGGLLVVGTVAMGVLAARLWLGSAAVPRVPGYVERESSHF